MSILSLSADCAQCTALCCVAYAFEQGQGFAEHKPAHQPCTHLVGTRCAIHRERDRRGFGGCTQYDCFGAGQLISQRAPSAQFKHHERTVLDAFIVARALCRQLALIGRALLLLPDAQLCADFRLLQTRIERFLALGLIDLSEFNPAGSERKLEELLTRLRRQHRAGGRSLPITE